MDFITLTKSTNARKRKNAKTFVDIIEVIKENGSLTIDKLRLIMNRRKTKTYEYLALLEKWGILQSKKFKKEKLWMLNSRLPIIRRD